jgi:hypothetical protein
MLELSQVKDLIKGQVTVFKQEVSMSVQFIKFKYVLPFTALHQVKQFVHFSPQHLTNYKVKYLWLKNESTKHYKMSFLKLSLKVWTYQNSS